MANLTKDQVRIILQNAPKGTDPARIIDGLVAQGNVLEGFNDKPKQKSTIQNIAEGIMRAPATMLARPIQATAMIAGADENTIDRVTKNIAGDFVAPIPRNIADVKKDIGRGAQTVALGMGPVSGGAAFGAGNSLEQGNDLLSAQTALQTVLGAGAGKVLDLVGKPLLDATGKVIGTITPQYIKDVASGGANAIAKFAEQHKILPEIISKPLNEGAAALETKMNIPFDAVGNAMKSPFSSIKKVLNPAKEDIIAQRMVDLGKIEQSKASIRNFAEKQKARGFNPQQDIASTDLLKGSVDNAGSVRTRGPGGPIEQYNDFIKPQEGIVNRVLKQDGTIIPLSDVEQMINSAIENSNIKGAAKISARNAAKKEIAGLRLDSVNGELPLATVHDAKVTKYSNINYMNPESASTDKIIAKALKETVEKHSPSNIKVLNEELSRHYANIGYLEKLDGAKVEGGRLGKQFSRVIGGMIGSHFGPLGTIAGSEVAGRLTGGLMENTFSGATGKELAMSPAMEQAVKTTQSLKNVGPRNINQSATKTTTITSIPKSVPRKTKASIKK